MTNILSHSNTAWEWITTDPSPWIGLVAAVAAFVLVTRNERLRFLIAAIPIAFFPLSLWLWDIPGTTLICPHFHDGKIGVRSWHLYLLGIVLYFPIVKLLMRGKTTSGNVPAFYQRGIPSTTPASDVHNLPRP